VVLEIDLRILAVVHEFPAAIGGKLDGGIAEFIVG